MTEAIPVSIAAVLEYISLRPNEKSESGESFSGADEIDFDRSNPTEPLRIVLVWTDEPGNHIQNNLQLEVHGPDRNYVGNQEHFFRKAALFDDKNSNNFPFDKHNNVEQVWIEFVAN